MYFEYPIYQYLQRYYNKKFKPLSIKERSYIIDFIKHFKSKWVKNPDKLFFNINHLYKQPTLSNRKFKKRKKNWGDSIQEWPSTVT